MESKNLLTKFKNSHFKKYDHIKKLLGNDSDAKRAMARIAKTYMTHRNSFAAAGVDFLRITSREQLEDTLHTVLEKQKALSLAKRVIPPRQHHLLKGKGRERVLHLFGEILNLKMRRSQISDKFLRALGAIKTSQALADLLENRLDIVTGKVPVDVKIKSAGGIPHHESETYSLYWVPNYEVCKKAGTKNWCVSRRSADWNYYTAGYAKFYILVNHLVPPSDPKHMTGMHINLKGEVSDIQSQDFGNVDQSSSWFKDAIETTQPTPFILDDLLNHDTFPHEPSGFVERTGGLTKADFKRLLLLLEKKGSTRQKQLLLRLGRQHIREMSKSQAYRLLSRLNLTLDSITFLKDKAPFLAKMDGIDDILSMEDLSGADGYIWKELLHEALLCNNNKLGMSICSERKVLIGAFLDNIIGAFFENLTEEEAMASRAYSLFYGSPQLARSATKAGAPINSSKKIMSSALSGAVDRCIDRGDKRSLNILAKTPMFRYHRVFANGLLKALEKGIDRIDSPRTAENYLKLWRQCTGEQLIRMVEGVRLIGLLLTKATYTSSLGPDIENALSDLIKEVDMGERITAFLEKKGRLSCPSEVISGHQMNLDIIHAAHLEGMVIERSKGVMDAWRQLGKEPPSVTAQRLMSNESLSHLFKSAESLNHKGEMDCETRLPPEINGVWNHCIYTMAILCQQIQHNTDKQRSLLNKIVGHWEMVTKNSNSPVTCMTHALQTAVKHLDTFEGFERPSLFLTIGSTLPWSSDCRGIGYNAASNGSSAYKLLSAPGQPKLTVRKLHTVRQIVKGMNGYDITQAALHHGLNEGNGELIREALRHAEHDQIEWLLESIEPSPTGDLEDRKRLIDDFWKRFDRTIRPDNDLHHLYKFEPLSQRFGACDIQAELIEKESQHEP